MGVQVHKIWTITNRAFAKFRPKMPATYAPVIEKLTSWANGSDVENAMKHQTPSRPCNAEAPRTERFSHRLPSSMVTTVARARK